MDDLISRADLFDELNRRGVPYNAEVNKVINGMPSAQQWIPCSERLPEEEAKTYWICTDTGHQCECRWTNINHFWTDLTTDWHWHWMDIPQYTKVVAWRELPEPWRGEER